MAWEVYGLSIGAEFALAVDFCKMGSGRRREAGKSGKRKAESGKRKAKSEKRKAKSEKRKAKSGKRKAESGKRKAESGKKRGRGAGVFFLRALPVSEHCWCGALFSARGHLCHNALGGSGRGTWLGVRLL